MAVSGIRVEFSREAVRARVKAATKRATFAMATQALKDSNYYAKHDQGALIDSSLTASDLDGGYLVWDTPYAKRQYYTGTPSKDINPNASTMWAHKARAQYGETWRKIGQDQLKEGV